MLKDESPLPVSSGWHNNTINSRMTISHLIACTSWHINLFAHHGSTVFLSSPSSSSSSSSTLSSLDGVSSGRAPSNHTSRTRESWCQRLSRLSATRGALKSLIPRGIVRMLRHHLLLLLLHFNTPWSDLTVLLDTMEVLARSVAEAVYFPCILPPAADSMVT